MTSDEFLSKLSHIADDLKTTYKKKFPYNCGYYNGSEWSWDCNNLIKSVINGWVENPTVGYYCHSFSPTGDISELGLLNGCTYASSNFAQKIKPGALLYMKGHVGVYTGLITLNGHDYNVIECTAAWGGKVCRSYVDKDGTRRCYNGGASVGRWTTWGLLKWIDYKEDTDDPDDVPQPTLRKQYRIVNGAKIIPVVEEVAKLQSCLNNLGFRDNAGRLLEVDGQFWTATEQAVKNLQRDVFPTDPREWDGIYGPKTASGLARLL